MFLRSSACIEATAAWSWTMSALRVALAGCLLAASAGRAAESVDADFVPAWEGYYVAGRATSLRVRANAPVGGELIVRLADTAPSSAAKRMIEAGAPAELDVGFRPSTDSVAASARVGIAEPVEADLELIALDRPLLALVVEDVDLGPWLSAAADFVPVPVSATELPRTAEGYEPISGLVIGERALARMDNAQIEALGRYADGCGRIFVPPSSSAVPLKQTAGCDGTFVQPAPQPADMAALLRRVVSPLPEYKELQALDASPPSLLGIAVAFFAVYAAILAVFAARGGRTQARSSWTALLLTPVLASVLMTLVWSRNAPERRLIVWAEQSGAGSARYSAVYDIYSRGVGNVELALPASFGLPASVTSEPFEVTRVDDRIELRLQPRLMTRYALGLTGSVDYTPALSVDVGGSAPAVANAGSAQSPEAILAHDRRYYRVPPLETGARWLLAADMPSLSRLDVPSPLTRSRGTALLVPLQPGELADRLPPSDRTTGWLLLTPDELVQ